MEMKTAISCLFFFFNDTATTEIYTLSLHDALPISPSCATSGECFPRQTPRYHDRSPHSPSPRCGPDRRLRDRKSTRLNSSHSQISYAVFCLKKKNRHTKILIAVGV